MTTRHAALAAAVLLCTAATAHADDVVFEEAPRVEYSKRTSIIFSEVDVEGALVGPASEYVVARKKVHFRNLIALRASFRRELIRSMP